MKQTAYFAQTLMLELVSTQFHHDIVVEAARDIIDHGSEFELMEEIFIEYEKEKNFEPKLSPIFKAAQDTNEDEFDRLYEETFEGY